VEGYAVCYNNSQYNSGGHKWRPEKAQGDDQELYFGLWPDIELSHGRRRTIFAHERFFLQAFLNPRRQYDMFSLRPTYQLGHMIAVMNILRCPARELGISPGIIIIHDNMGQFRIVQVRRDDSSIFAKGFSCLCQSSSSATKPRLK